VKGWQPPRREVLLTIGLTPDQHVATVRTGARLGFEQLHLRFRAVGWEGEWRLHGATLRRAGTPDLWPMRQLGSVPDWLADLIEMATLEVKLHG
jgi:hypothetical protein